MKNGTNNECILQGLRRLRICIEECIIDSIKFDKYEDRVRMLFHFSQSDASCLQPKVCDLSDWHVSFFSNIDLMGILHTCLKELMSKNTNEAERKRNSGKSKDGEIFVSTMDEIGRIMILLGRSYKGYQIMTMNLESFYKLLCEMNGVIKDLNEIEAGSIPMQFKSYFQVSSMQELLHQSNNHVINPIQLYKQYYLILFETFKLKINSQTLKKNNKNKHVLRC